jgi:hypothetical protein
MFNVTYSILFIFIVISIENNAQKSTASFLYWQPSAESYAMGGIGAALHNDIYSAYYNPAGLAFSKRMTFAGSFVKPFPFFGNIANSFFGISYKIDNSNAISISGNLFWMGKQIRTGEDSPEAFGVEDTPLQWHIKLSYGLKLMENFSAGVSLGLLNVNLSDETVGQEFGDPTSLTVLVDAGIFVKNLLPEATLESRNGESSYLPFFEWLLEIGEENKFKGLSLGLAVSNLGPDIAYIDEAQADPPPSKLTFGVSYIPVSLETFGILIGTDFEKRLNESNNSDYIHLGGEIKIFKVFAIRSGYFLGASDSELSYFTFGGGIALKWLSINIARYNRSLQSTWHFDSIISLEF